MSTRSSSSNLVPPFFDPESVIRNRQRNLNDPSLLLDFKEINMNPNNVQGPPPTGPPPQNHNGPSGLNLQMPAPDLRTMEELCQPTMNGRGGSIAPDTLTHRGESSGSTISSSSEIATLAQRMIEMRKDMLQMYRSNQQVNYVTPSCGNTYQPQGNRNLLSYRSNNFLGPSGFNPPNNQKQGGRKSICSKPNGRNEEGSLAETSGCVPLSPASSSSKEVERDRKPTMDQVHISSPKSTARVPFLIVQPSPSSRSSKIPLSPSSSPSQLPKRNPRQPAIPYPSRLNKKKLQDKYDIQVHKFLQMFKKLHFNVSLVEALALMPKYDKMLKGKFTFSADFVVVDYDVDPRVPLILGRPFLRTNRALVDVYGKELILRDGDENLIFHADSTSKYPPKHGNKSINMISFIDITCEDHFNEVLKFQKSIHHFSGSTTSSFDSFPSLTSSKTSDSSREEFSYELALLDPFSPGNEDDNFDPEANLREIEYLLNRDPSTDSSPETDIDFIDPILESFTDEPALVWKKLMLPELILTRMTLELANRFVAYPAGKFTFSADFVFVDYEVDPRVLLILGRPFLRTTRALVDVYGKELILRDGDEKLIFHADSTSKYPPKHGNNTTSSFDYFPSLTSSKTSDSSREEFSYELALLDPFSPGNEDDNFDPEANLREIEYLVNRDPSTDSSPETDIDFIDPILESFTDEPALVYSFPLEDDDDDFFDFNDSTLPGESSEIATLLSSPFGNEDKVFNPGILILGGTQIFHDESKDKDLKVNSSTEALLFLVEKKFYLTLLIVLLIVNSCSSWSQLIPYDREDHRACFQSSDNFDPEANLREIEYLVNRDPSTDSSPETDIDFIDPILESFTDEPALVYSFPLEDDDDDFFDFKSDNEKWKKNCMESSEIATLLSSPFRNEDKVFNPGILILGGTQIFHDESKDKDLKVNSSTEALLFLVEKNSISLF
nr:hypothetical protein [Tanacetum cinerariifolium]